MPGSVTGTTNITGALPGFWCANEGHIGSYVPFMYVNDGVCDYDLCCDGSEEFAHVGGIKCENRCGPIGKEWRRVEEERKKSKERSAARRAALLGESHDLRRRVQTKISELRQEINALEAKKLDLQRKFEEVERSERGKVVKDEGQGGKLGVLLSQAKSRVKELRETLDKVMDQRDDLQDRVDKLEDILTKFREEYNPNFNDEGVKAAVKSWEDYSASNAAVKDEIADADIMKVLEEDGETSGINWAEFVEGDSASDADVGMFRPFSTKYIDIPMPLTLAPALVYNLEAYLPTFVRDYIHDKLNQIRVWMIENGILADNPKTGQESLLVKAAREALEAAKNDFTSKTSQLEEEEKDLQKDYGPGGIFRALKGKCVSSDVGEYEYELCWMDKTMQKSKKGHGNTNMGNFVRIDREIADEEERVDGKSLGKGERLVLRYENGQGCWNGPNRRTDVWLACAETDELWKVSESEKCVYRMEIGTPAACEDVHESRVRNKDEL